MSDERHKITGVWPKITNEILDYMVETLNSVAREELK